MPPLSFTGPEPASHQLALFVPTNPYGPTVARLAAALNSVGPLTTTLTEARLFAVEELRRSGEVTALSLSRFSDIWSRFESFADRGHGVRTVDEVGPDLVRAFVAARVSRGRVPKLATQKLRVTAIRLWWQVLRRYHLATTDPTLDLALGTRTDVPCRPLTDGEVEDCRSASLKTTVETRQPAIWALAESGASTSEIGVVTPADLDLTLGTVFLTGGPKGFARTNPLTEWSRTQLTRRVALGAATTGSLTYSGDGDDHSRRTAITGVVTGIMQRAGLYGDPLVGPRSVTAWAGRCVLAQTGQVDAVARHLGLRSLDLAATVIGFDWRVV